MIYEFFADGFEEVEAITPLDYLRRAGIDVFSVGVGKKSVKGAHGIIVECDIASDDVIFNKETDGIILPGGMPGTINLENDCTVQSAIDFCAENNKMIAAICAAPSILGHKNLLHNKKAVCFPGFEKDLYCAKICDEFAVTDANFITAKGAGSACEFAFKIIEYLVSQEKANEIKESVMTCCK